LTGIALPPPFLIDAMTSQIIDEPSAYRTAFEDVPALLVEGAIETTLLQSLLDRAAAAQFVNDHVKHIGPRQIESPQKVGKIVNLLLERPNLLTWLEAATGVSPLGSAAGRLVQTRANQRDELAWHDDRVDDKRQLGVVVNLSGATFEGGDFEMRYKTEKMPFLSFRHNQPGSIMLFAVRSDLEHRVTPLISGGPRRVYAGWLMSNRDG
jgi:hypothetical protein